MIVKKVWGEENILCNEPEYCCKYLYIDPNKKCSLHSHKVKKETFIVKHGTVNLEHGETKEVLYVGDVRTILPDTPHRFSSRWGATIIEVSTHHDDEDVERLEPSGEI